MFDLPAVQAALRAVRPRRLAALRLPRPERAGPPRPRLRRRRHRCRGAGSTSSPASGEPRKLVHRIEPHALDAYPGAQTVYLRWQELEAGVADAASQGAQDGRDGVRAAQRQPLRLARRCRHGRAGAVVRRRGRAVGRPDPAVRGVLGRRAVGDAPGGGEAHARGLRRGLRRSSPSASRSGGSVHETRGAAGASWTTSPNTAWSPTTRRSSASARTAATRTTRRGAGDRRADPRGRLRPDRPVGQARQAAGGLQRPDLDRLRRHRGAGEVRARSSSVVAAARDAAIATRAATRSRTASRCRAGRSTRRPAT